MVIFKMFRKFLLATALVLGLSAGAQANVPILDVTGTSSGSFLVNASYGFSISTPGWYQVTLTDNAVPTAFETLVLNILPGLTTTGSSLGGISGPGTFSFPADTAGLYTALLFGVPGAGNAGSFSFGVSIVPEVETWVMLLVGIGLIAYQLRRKNKVLRLG